MLHTWTRSRSSYVYRSMHAIIKAHRSSLLVSSKKTFQRGEGISVVDVVTGMVKYKRSNLRASASICLYVSLEFIALHTFCMNRCNLLYTYSRIGYYAIIVVVWQLFRSLFPLHVFFNTLLACCYVTNCKKYVPLSEKWGEHSPPAPLLRRDCYISHCHPQLVRTSGDRHVTDLILTRAQFA